MPLIQKMLLTLLAIALLPVFLVGSTFYVSSNASTHDRAVNHLTAVAAIQASRVETLITRNEELLNSFTSRLALRLALDRYSRTKATTDKALMQQIITETQAGVPSFKVLSVANLAGEVVASTSPTAVGRNYSREAFFTQGKIQNDVTSHFFRDTHGNPGLYLVGPLKLEGRLVGVAIIEWDTRSLMAATSDYAGLGQTGEIELVKQDERGDAIFLTPLRHDPTAALQRRVARSETENPAVRSLQEPQRVLADARDYRGQRVLAVTHRIAAADWGLVVKVDRAEVLQPVQDLGNILLVAVFIVSVLVIIVSFYLARRLNEPILVLAAAADRIRSGDLSARAKVSTKDEIGQLAGMFNAMAGNLEKIDQLKSEFVLLTSHQLRTPATAVKGFISMLLDGYAGKISAKQRELATAAYTENERQIGVINSILDVAKLEAGEVTLVRATRDIIPIIEASAAGQASLLASKNQKLTFIKPQRPVLGWVDAERLQLVIDNLIHNAIKYSPTGTTIVIELKRQAGRILIRVTDQGIGIARKDLRRLFKRFSRITNSKTATIPGAGLGLYLAEKLVVMHDGQIKVRSQEGKGTSFTIELPNVRKEDAKS